jgi:outer membrane receptor protein involved in Fe transport
MREPHDNDFANVRMSINGRLGDAQFISATSWTTHEVDSRLDATASSALFGLAGPALFRDKRKYRLFNQEFRLSGDDGRWHWMTGLSLLQSPSALNARLQSSDAPDMLIGTLDQEAREWALFGDIGYDLGPRWTLETGARLFATMIRDEKVSLDDPRQLKSTRRGISPSASLVFKPSPRQYYYVRFASAFRPRGLSPFAPVPQAQYASDELNALELGGRWHRADRRLEGQAVLYTSKWTDIQSDYLLPNGLVATRNSGKGQIYGISLSGKWAFAPDWQLASSAEWQHAQLEKPIGDTAAIQDRQLPVVPGYKASVTLSRHFPLGPWQAETAAHLMLMGPTHLSLDPAIDRRVGPYEGLDLSLSARRGQWRINLSVQNLFDSRADSFAYGNPFSFAATSQHVSLRPRAIGIGLGWNFAADRD